MKQFLALVLSATAFLGMAFSTAQAATVNLLFVGKIDTLGVPPGTPSPFQLGDTVTFHLVYDTPSVDTDPATPDQGVYYPFHAIEVGFLGNTVAFDPASTQFATSFGGFNQFTIQTSNTIAPWFILTFLDFPGVGLNDDSLPTDLALFQAMENQRFILFVPSANSNVRGQFTSISYAPIPAALPLLATALGGLGFLGWRRRRDFARRAV